MRVVHVARGRDWRGGERQVLRLMQRLSAEHHLDQVLLTAAGCPLARAAGDAGLPVHQAAWRAGLDPRTLVPLHRLLRAAPPDTLLHAHDSHALLLAAIAARWHGIPLVATRRSVTIPGRHGPWPRANGVIAISEAVSSALRASGVIESRISVVPSSVPLERLAAAAGDRPLDGLILAVGALTQEKGHDVLLAALALLLPARSELRLLIAGSGPERGALERQARRLGIATRVEFAGQVDDILPLLRRATVLAHPSRREALGTAVLEAMAVGLPVVASRTGGLIEVLHDGAGLLVPPGNPAALADALRLTLEDPVAADGRAALARQRVRRYDETGMTGRVMRVYRSLLSAP